MDGLKHRRRAVVTAVACIAAGALMGAGAASAWYGPFVFTSPSTMKPGGEVQVHGVYFSSGDPVAARLDAIDGRVLAVFTPEPGGKGREFSGPIPVPEDATPGVHTLVFTQSDPDGQLVQMPVRALLTVTDASGAAPVLSAPVASDLAPRPVALARADDESLDAGDLVLIGLGVAATALFVVGIAAVIASRSSAAPSRAVSRQEG